MNYRVILTTPSGRVETTEYRTLWNALRAVRRWYGQLDYTVRIEEKVRGGWIETDARYTEHFGGRADRPPAPRAPERQAVRR